MPEIGPTLREARMRARLDITEIEAQTKIRAKYLRALENEEWELLPGPAYVKTFLRTYAEALDLDAKLLVEEYKLRHERLSEIELQPISPRSSAQTQRRRAGPAGPPRTLVVGVVVVLLLGALWVLGQSGDEGGTQAANTVTAPEEAPAGGGEREREGGERASGSEGSSSSSSNGERERERRPRRVRLQLIATGPGPVYVCLVGDDEVLVRGETLQPGDRTRTFRARRYVMNLGNGMVAMNINGRRRSVEPSSNNIVLELTQENGRQPYDNAPTCGV